MVLRSARPMRRKGSSQAQFVKRIPADLKQVAKGKSTRVILPAVEAGGEPEVVFPTAGAHHISFSLRLPTVHPAVARRHAAASEQVEAWFAALRVGPRPLTHEQKVAIAGEAYRVFAEGLSSDPILTPDQWEALAASQDAELMLSPLVIGPPELDLAQRLERRYGPLADAVLRSRRLVVTTADRSDIIRQIARNAPVASRKLARNADGDYSSDPYASRFPSPAVLDTKQQTAAVRVPWDVAIANWKKVRSPTSKTAKEWERIVRDFADYSGKRDASGVLRQDVRRWRDHLRQDRRLSIKSINDSHLAALNAVFRAAVREELLRENPVTETKLQAKKTTRDRMNGYTDLEAGHILRAATRETRPVFRWAPLLMALSGARVGEVCQLRGGDFDREGGLPFFWVRHQVKTGVVRRVPVHPELVRRGLLDFAADRGKSPLFFDPERRTGEDPHRVLVKDLGTWAHNTGVAVGRAEHRKDPNHAWRHWLITTLRRHDTPQYVIQAIVGHTGGGITGRYGETPLSKMAEALSRVPLAELLTGPSD